MKRTLVFTILGLATALSFSAHARRISGAAAYADLECSKLSGVYPANQISIKGAVSESGQVYPTDDDPNGFVINFLPRDISWTGRVNMRAGRLYAGTYYYSDFTCTGNL